MGSRSMSPASNRRISRRSALAASATITWNVSAQLPPARFQYLPANRGSHGKLEVINTIPVLKVSGTPREIGQSTGLLALRQAAGLLNYPKSLISQFKLDPLWPVLVALGTRMVDRFPDEIKQELASLQESSGVDRNALVAGNTMFDLKAMVLCSGLALTAAKSGTGGTLLGRNLDYPPVGDIGQYSLITVVRQPGLRAFASVGFPGMIGVLSGINESGLALAIHEVVDVRAPQRKFNPLGLPYAICYRKVLENCSTISESIEYLGKLPRASATNLLVADKAEVACLEITPGQIRRMDPKDNASACTNHFRHPENLPENPANPFQSVERLACLRDMCRTKETLGIKGIQHALHAANLGQNTLQSMVFDTRNLQVHLATGKPPSSAGPYFSLDLGPLLKGP